METQDLLTAVRSGSTEHVLAILPGSHSINARDFDGGTPLTRAAATRPTHVAAELVRALLEAGASVSQERPQDGVTSVHAAAEQGNTDALRELLAADGYVALTRFDYLSRTPLICAAMRGHVGAAELLLSAGAHVNAADEAHLGNSALIVAVEEGQLAMVEFLLRRGADPLQPGWMGLTALDRAHKWRDSQTPELRRIAELVELEVALRR